MAPNPYSVLGLKTDATQEEIKKAYRVLALKARSEGIVVHAKLIRNHCVLDRVLFYTLQTLHENVYVITAVLHATCYTACIRIIAQSTRVNIAQFHPDRNPGKGALDEFRRVTLAYEQLEDPAKRKEFDATAPRSSSGGFAGGRTGAAGAPADDLTEDELRDFQRAYGHRFTQDPFENVFNRRAREQHAAWERKFSEYEQKVRGAETVCECE